MAIANLGTAQVHALRAASISALLFSALLSGVTADQPDIGIPIRVQWTTSNISGSPEPPLPFVTERAFPALTFNQCLDITHAPGSDRLFVVEQSGKIFSFPSKTDVEAADLVVDLKRAIPGVEQVYALAFHPDFIKNRYCYVCYIQAAGQADGTHVARFRLTNTEPPTIDVASETTVITWLSGGHNGCCLKFGPDGYLYISTGDGEGPNPPDIRRTGQDVSDLLSSILRIDVDHMGDGRNYRIPPDNPFVDLDGARGEIWAYGLRNPWRMSFDRKTGDLWVGDVGWELWELLDRVERGGNYGWSVKEGNQATNPEWPRGPTQILPPTIEHPHSESSSITDGLTYYGSRLPKLHGHHIYGDYDTGKIWGFRYEQGRVVDHRELADTTLRIVGFGDDSAGEAYILDHVAGTIHRLTPNPQRNQQGDFPRRLSETGLFVSTADLRPAAGVIPYSVNAEPWADHAVAERMVAIPGESAIRADKATWSFPVGAVLAKTISLDLRHGDASSRRRIETQILHFDGIDWQPYTYRWTDDQTDALLLDADGAEQEFKVTDLSAPGGKRIQTWRFPGRGECQRCHNKWSGPPLAFNTLQLNRQHDSLGVMASQLDTFVHIGLLEKLPTTKKRRWLDDPYNENADLDRRARAYLQVNCSHCHRKNAGGAVNSQMQYDLSLAKTTMLGERPTQGTFGIHSAQVIAPGDPFRSVLFYRMSKLGGGRMPHIGSSEVDQAGVRLVSDWIRQLPLTMVGNSSSDEAAVEKLSNHEQAVLDQFLSASESSSIRMELLENLLSSTSGALMLLERIEDQSLAPKTISMIVNKATTDDEVCVRDLFERFIPREKRTRRLGSVVQAEQILSLVGDAVRGHRLFSQTEGVQCKSCHRLEGVGQEMGPDLTEIARKQDRSQLLESILEPSKSIDPKYLTYLAETEDGRLLSGLLVKKDEREVILRDAQNKIIRIPTLEIESFVPQRQSLMPELLLRDMTGQQVADLLAYLGSLN